MGAFYDSLGILVQGMGGVFAVILLIWGGVAVLRRIGR